MVRRCGEQSRCHQLLVRKDVGITSLFNETNCAVNIETSKRRHIVKTHPTENMSDNDEQSEFEWEDCPLPKLEEVAENSGDDSLPTKSKKLYESTYDAFLKWKHCHETKLTSESVLIAYFKVLSEKYKSSTLWSIYSMLKATLKTKENIDISDYYSFKAFMKEKSSGFVSKKSSVLSSENIEKFLSEAPNDQYLATKVALIFGIAGACRSYELVNIKLKDVTKEGNLLVVSLRDTKTKKPRTFGITKEFAKIVQRYMDLRPRNASTDRFFLNFQKGKCTSQVIGIHKFAKMPKEIAGYLNLDDPSSYTGHAFRKTAATLFADGGTNTDALKRHAGQKSSDLAEGSIEEIVKNEFRIGNVVSMAVNFASAGLSERNTDGPPPKRQKSATITSREEKSEVQLNMVTDESSSTKKNLIFNNCTFIINRK